jgi:hypothetical protein
MEEGKSTRLYDEQSELWYEVRWDDELGYYVWNIAPHQQLIEEAKPRLPNE